MRTRQWRTTVVKPKTIVLHINIIIIMYTINHLFLKTNAKNWFIKEKFPSIFPLLATKFLNTILVWSSLLNWIREAIRLLRNRLFFVPLNFVGQKSCAYGKNDSHQQQTT